MKKILSIILAIIAIEMSISAQIDQKDFYQMKLTSSKKLKDFGVGVTIFGLGLTTVGMVILGSQSALFFQNNHNINLKQYDATFGRVVTDVGIVSTIGGIVLISTGSKKKYEYTKKLNQLTFKLNPGFQNHFSLVYNF